MAAVATSTPIADAYIKPDLPHTCIRTHHLRIPSPFSNRIQSILEIFLTSSVIINIIFANVRIKIGSARALHGHGRC